MVETISTLWTRVFLQIWNLSHFATVWTVCFSCHHGKGTNPFSTFSLIAEAFIFTWTKAKILSEKPTNFFLVSNNREQRTSFHSWRIWLRNRCKVYLKQLMYTLQAYTNEALFWELIIDGFHGAWFHFRRTKSGSVFSAAVC